jgi:hypothetical protein
MPTQLFVVLAYFVGMFVSSAGSYCAEVSPLALRGITTASVNLWIDCKYYFQPNFILVEVLTQHVTFSGSIVCSCSSCIFIRTLLNRNHSLSNGVIRGTGNRTDAYAYRLPL